MASSRNLLVALDLAGQLKRLWLAPNKNWVYAFDRVALTVMGGVAGLALATSLAIALGGRSGGWYLGMTVGWCLLEVERSPNAVNCTFAHEVQKLLSFPRLDTLASKLERAASLV